jgi:hypothetical protein
LFEIEEHALELRAHCNIAGRDIFKPVSKVRRLPGATDLIMSRVFFD